MTLRHLSLFLSTLALTFFVSCTETPPSSGTSGSESTSTTTETETTEETPSQPELAAPNCSVDGEVLDGNQIWLQSPDVLAVIKADASTAAEGYGPSHRILQIMDGRSCETKFQTELPENVSPDYPYYIAEVQYNTLSSIIGIQGFYKALICDMSQDYKVTELEPEYFVEREYDDPQTGMVQRLEVWEDYLLGYAQDCGAFAFDLSDRANPKAVIPFAEWQNPEAGDYHSLFLLPTEGGVQGIIPAYDAEEDAFMLHPLFDKPVEVSDQVQRSARNNRLLVLRQTNVERTPLAINLDSRELMELPTEVAGQATQDIIEWMRGRE